MPQVDPFEKYTDLYENWFVRNRFAYQSEIEAIRRHLPFEGRGLEIGVGSGLFAEPLGIHDGIEPSENMRKRAKQRGIKLINGIAETLPFIDDSYDFALMVTTICFLDDVRKSIGEAWRVIKCGGKLIIGLIDKNSTVGKLYQKYKHQNVFYQYATFYSPNEVAFLMKRCGFIRFYFTQTIFRRLDEIYKPEMVKEGYGEGSFVVVSGLKKYIKK